jgi:cytochrome c peroxidase
LAEQAKGPFLNPREMAMPSKAAVIDQIRAARYAPLFKRVFGVGSLDNVDEAYDRVAQAIEAFELTERFQPFSSKFDAVLRGKARFTQAEARGFELFKSPQKGNCIGCHAGEATSHEPTDWLFTDFTYDNLGVPRNLDIPDNADPAFYDLGLCERPGIEGKAPLAAGDAAELVRSLCGAFKVPTLRNVAKTAPYMHNGFFKQLRDVVEFYVTRDTNPGKWYPRAINGEVQKFNDLPSAYHGNVNTSEVPYDRKIGEPPHLDAEEIDDVVAFLNTLSDDD